MNRFKPVFSLLVVIPMAAACSADNIDTTDATPPESAETATEPGAGPDDGDTSPADTEPPTGGGSDSDPDDSGDDPDDSGDGASTDEPAVLDSDWQITDQYLTEDGCNMADWIDSREEGSLTVRGSADAFSITHNRGAETCGLTGADTYLCDERYDEDTTVADDFGLDALLLLTLTAEGEMLEDELMMETTITADCEGRDCWLVELTTGRMPCDSLLMVEAERSR